MLDVDALGFLRFRNVNASERDGLEIRDLGASVRILEFHDDARDHRTTVRMPDQRHVLAAGQRHIDLVRDVVDELTRSQRIWMCCEASCDIDSHALGPFFVA